MNRLTVIASENEDVNLVCLEKRCDEYPKDDINNLLTKHADIYYRNHLVTLVQ